MTHPVLVPGAVAVVTGGASGIGLAAARRFAELGLRVCVADLGAERLADAADALAAAAPDGAAAVMTARADVSLADDLVRLEAAVRARFGGTDVLMLERRRSGAPLFGPGRATGSG